MRDSTDKYSRKLAPQCGMLIRMMRRGIISIPCILLVTLCLLSTSLGQDNKSEPCPIPQSVTIDPDHQLAFGKIPPVLQPGTQIDVQISPALTGEQKITALCFDTLKVPPVDSQTAFSLTIPAANATAPT